MDCFVFASQSETQGLVLAEAMATGTPVVALDGPGVREIVRDGENGLMLEGHASARDFTTALRRLMEDLELTVVCSRNARATAADYDTGRCVARMLDCYTNLIASYPGRAEGDPTAWDRLLSGIGIEWSLLVEKMSAAAAAVNETPATEALLD